MSSLITKIGADSSDFRSDVGKLPAFVKQNFDKMKQASEGGLVENVKNIKKGFGDLKDVVVGGGIVGAVVAIHNGIVSQAEKSKNATDENVMAVRRYSRSLGELKELGNNFGVAFYGSLNRLGESAGTFLKGAWASATGTRAEFEASEAALAATEKAAARVDRNLAEAKKNAAAFNALNAESKKLTEERAGAEMKSLSLSEQRAVLTQQLMEAERAEQEAGENGLLRRTAQVEQLKIGNKLMEVSKALDQEAAKEREKIAKIRDDERKIVLDSLAAEERAVIIAKEVVALEAMLQSAGLSQETSDRTRLALAERRKELLVAETKAAEDRAKAEEKNEAEREKAADKHIAAAEKLTKLRFDQLTPAEKVAALEKDQAQIQQSIYAAKAKGNDTTEMEVALIETQNALLTETEKLQKNIGGEITNSVEKVYSLNEAWDKFLISLSRTGREAEDQSTIALEGALSRARSQLQALERDTSYQSVWSPEGKNPLYYTLQMEVQQMQNELNARKRVSGYAAAYGEDASRYKFGDTLTDKALRDLQDDSARTRTAIESIERRMKNSALFRKGG